MKITKGLIESIEKYATKYDTTFAASVADRDFPMTKNECVALFKAWCGSEPNEKELKQMSPDPDEAVAEERYRFGDE